MVEEEDDDKAVVMGGPCPRVEGGRSWRPAAAVSMVKEEEEEDDLAVVIGREAAAEAGNSVEATAAGRAASCAASVPTYSMPALPEPLGTGKGEASCKGRWENERDEPKTVKLWMETYERQCIALKSYHLDNGASIA